MVVFHEFFQQCVVSLAKVQWIGLLLRSCYFAQADHGCVAALGKLAVHVIHVGYAAAHASSEVAPGFAEHHHRAARHVFAAMIACAFHNCRCARQTHCKALTGYTAQEGFALGCAIEHGVAHDDVLSGVAPEINAWAHHDAATAHAFAGVIVGLANQIQRDAASQKRAEALAACAFELDADRVIGQALGAVALGHFARKHRAHGAVHITRGFDELDFLAFFQCSFGFFNQLQVQRFVQSMVLYAYMLSRHIRRHFRLIKHAAEIEALRLPVRDAFAGIEQLSAANQIVKLFDAQLRHDAAHFFGHEEEIVHHMLRLALEFGAQNWVLRSYTHGAGVEMAFAHHDAALDHQRCSGKAHLVCAQQCRNHHITAGLHLAIGLHANAATQAVEHEGLLRFS